MTNGSTARRLVVTVAAAVVASGLAALTAGATTTAASGAPSAGTSAPRTAPSGGMYGELAGSPTRTVPQATIKTQPAASSEGGGTGHYNDNGTICSVYANQAGMGSYCTSGKNVGVPQPLIKRFPGMKFENCRYEDPPPGVDVPPNPSQDEEKWQLRTCLTAINWFSWNGGNDRRIIMDLVLVDKDKDTTYDETPLSRFLWNTMQTMYPIPMLRVEPKTYPVVNQEAYLTFDWLDPKSRRPVDEGPFKNQEGGGPFVRRVNRGMVMEARATSLRIDPQVKGMDPITCSADPRDLKYDEDKPPRHQDQPSECYLIFKRSSAAAPEISTAPAYLDGDKYVFRPDIRVRWDVRYSRSGGGMRRLGDGYEMVVKQDLPVLDAEAVNVPVPDSTIG